MDRPARILIVEPDLETRAALEGLLEGGQALTHSQLLGLVWGEGQRDQREVKLYVSYLRRKLRTAGVEPIETVCGIGYRYRPQRVEGPRASTIVIRQP